MISLMIILNTQRTAMSGMGKSVVQLHIFGKVVRDLKIYCQRVHHFDKNFISIGFLFQKEIMPYVDNELMKALVQRTNQFFDQLTADQISYASLNSYMFNDKDPRNRKIKEELFANIDKYLEAKQSDPKNEISRKCAQQLMIAIASTNLGTTNTWKIAEKLFVKELEKENSRLKENLEVSHELTRKEILQIIHSLARRRVQDKDVWKHLMPPLMKHFKEGTITLRELSNMTYDLFIIKL